MAKICLDPGHGGSDPGAVAFGRQESADVLKLAKKIQTLLKAQGVTVVMTRETDVKKTIKERTDLANKEKCDYFISLHRNSFDKESAKGAEVWVYSKSKDLTHAKKIQAALTACGYTDRGVKLGAPSYTDFGVNSGTNMISCLAEVGFISNKGDNTIYDSKLDTLALELSKALCYNIGKNFGAPPKSAAEVAKEVYAGKWGNWPERERALTAAGYNYQEVQSEVNKLVAADKAAAEKRAAEEAARLEAEKAAADKKAAEAAARLETEKAAAEKRAAEEAARIEALKAEAERKAAELRKQAEAEKAAAEAAKKAEEEKKAEAGEKDQPVDETPKEAFESFLVKLAAFLSKLFGK